MGEVVRRGLCSNPESALQTAGADIARLVRQAADLNLSPAFSRFRPRAFAHGVERDCGPEEHVAVAKLFMKGKSPSRAAGA